MHQRTDGVNKRVRVELLRARAALERETLAQDIAHFSESLKPSQMLKRFAPKLGVREGSRLAWQLFTSVRRYPAILSTLSTLFLHGKYAKPLKLAAGLLASWQVYRAWRARQSRG